MSICEAMHDIYHLTIFSRSKRLSGFCLVAVYRTTFFCSTRNWLLSTVNTKTDSILIEVRRTERMKIILQLSVLLLLAATIEIASTCVDVKPDGCSVPSWVGWQETFRRACNKHDMCYICVSWRIHGQLKLVNPTLPVFRQRLNHVQ